MLHKEKTHKERRGVLEMKKATKIASLILTVWMLILCVAGCGSNSEDDGKSHKNTISASVNAELLNIVVGEWSRFSGEMTEYETVIVKKDGTVALSGNTYKWDIADESLEIEDITTASRFYLKIVNDSKETVKKLMFERNYDYKNELDGTYLMKIANTNDCFCNKEVFDVVEITTSNFFEYFEERDIFIAHKDKFGDYTEAFDFSRGWAIKEGFNVAADKSNISYKCSHTVGVFEFEFNKETGGYKILGAKNSYNDVYHQQERRFGMNETGVFFGSVGMPQVSSETIISSSGYLLNSCPQNIKLDGVIGTLYLYKNN